MPKICEHWKLANWPWKDRLTLAPWQMQLHCIAARAKQVWKLLRCASPWKVSSEEERMTDISPFARTELLHVITTHRAAPPHGEQPLPSPAARPRQPALPTDSFCPASLPRLGFETHIKHPYLFPTRKWSHFGKPHIQPRHIQSNQRAHLWKGFSNSDLIDVGMVNSFLGKLVEKSKCS